MREIDVSDITQAVHEMCIEANCILSKDIYAVIQRSIEKETSPIEKQILQQLIANSRLAEEKQQPICQDTGMAVIFVEIGQDLHVIGGSIEDAIHAGVRSGYQEGYLRKSVVKDPFERVNTNDNTPAVIHYKIVSGEKIQIEVVPKGFGSENMSRIYMLKPADGMDGAKRVILKTIDENGSKACPPIIVGVGIGGTFEKAAFLSKKALTRPLGKPSDKLHICKMEEELLVKINQLGIGPQGLGGKMTAIGVHIETYPTHIAGLPVAVNISCHATRHISRIL